MSYFASESRCMSSRNEKLVVLGFVIPKIGEFTALPLGFGKLGLKLDNLGRTTQNDHRSM